MELNLFFEAVDSIGGYQSRLLQAIDNEIHFNKCVCTVKAVDDLDVYDEDKYVPINYDVCERNRYEELYDMNSLIPLDKDILEKMLPYESTALKMLVRNMERDIYTYDESKRLYLNHLRFWNHIFVTHKINYVVQVCVPHHCHDYIIYALAKIYGCGLMVLEMTSIRHHYISVPDMYKINEELQARYNECLENTDFTLSASVEKYYQALLIENRDVDKSFLHGNVKKEKHAKNMQNIYYQYFRRKSIWRRNKGKLKKLVLNGILKFNGTEIRKQRMLIRQDLDYVKRARIKQRQMGDINYFNSLTEDTDYSKPFVVFFLHYQPEATTLPLAGVFVEQELVIALLADELEKQGIELWVKDHYVQACRTKSFYNTIKNTKNVRLIHTGVNSMELMEKSVATATCNGSIIQESIFNLKPVLAFGNGPFVGAPGSLPCGNRDDVRDAVDKISKGYVVDAKKVRAYLKAFDELVVYTNIYVSHKNLPCDLSEEDSIQNMVRAVAPRVRAHMHSLEQTRE